MNQQQTYMRDNIAYWTKRAPSYSQANREELHTGQRQVWARALESRIQKQFGDKSPREIPILDVGTGPGFFAILLAGLGYPVTAVDYTPLMLEQARKNAGPLAGQIRFRQMNAQELPFSDEQFAVVVSRNVTWNLPSPRRAYEQWTRVLRPGGLILNFDANWYRYLYDPQAEKAHHTDKEQVRAAGVKDDTAGTDIPAMEALARQAPLSRQHRPQWDREMLRGLGLDVTVEPEVWKEVWTREEWLNNASTPMFLVTAVKPAGNAGGRSFL